MSEPVALVTEKITPFGSRLVVKRVESKTAGGIFVARAQASDARHDAVLVEIMEGRLIDEWGRSTEPGARVYIAPMSGFPVRVNDIDALIVEGDAVLAILS